MAQEMPPAARRSLDSARWNRVLAVALATVSAWVLYMGPGPRVGDAYDYYVMLISWAQNGTPYSTPRIGAIYESYVETRQDGHTFERYFPGWPPSTKVYSHHFWFYSLLAAPFYWPLKCLGCDVGLSFNLLHLALLSWAVYVANRRLGPLAALSVILLAVASPAWWFVNKAHTEFFTVMTTTVAMVLFLDRRYAHSAVWFAAAAAQNAPFGVLVLVTLGAGFAEQRWQLFPRHKTALLLAAGLMLLQPAFCLSTRGTLTAIGAMDVRLREPMYHLRCLVAYWVDPDMGMFANWWLALPIVVLFFFLCARRVVRFRTDTALLAILAILVLGFSQTLTTNVNHGGTVHISRYCLWFLFLFFAMQWHILVWLAGERRPVFWAVALVALVPGGWTTWQYRPARQEEFLRPSAVSNCFYAAVPSLYDPLGDVFYGRHGGKVVPVSSETGVERSVRVDWAVSDASGNKILIHPEAIDFSSPQEAPPVVGCPGLDPAAVYLEAQRRLARQRKKEDFYLSGLRTKLSRPAAKQPRHTIAE